MDLDQLHQALKEAKRELDTHDEHSRKWREAQTVITQLERRIAGLEYEEKRRAELDAMTPAQIVDKMMGPF